MVNNRAFKLKKLKIGFSVPPIKSPNVPQSDWLELTMKELWASGNKNHSRLKARKKIGDTSIQQLAL